MNSAFLNVVLVHAVEWTELKVFGQDFMFVSLAGSHFVDFGTARPNRKPEARPRRWFSSAILPGWVSADTTQVLLLNVSEWQMPFAIQTTAVGPGVRS
jgi:hypothetical protein